MVGTYYLVISHVIHQQIKDFFRLILCKNIFFSFQIINIIFVFKSAAGLILYLTLYFIFRLPQMLFAFPMYFERKVPHRVIFHLLFIYPRSQLEQAPSSEELFCWQTVTEIGDGTQ